MGSAELARTKLDRPALAPLWTALWDRFSEGRPVSRVRVGPLDNDQRAAVADLLGRMHLPDEYLGVSISALDPVLLSSVGLDARGVVEAICGPFDNRSAARAAVRTAREQLWSWLVTHPVVTAEPVLDDWVAGIKEAGVSGSVDATRTLLDKALTVLTALPADGSPLATLAATTCGHPHALNDGTRVSSLVLKALAAIYGVPPPTDAEQRRALWQRAGVACDALSTTVLVAGLRPADDDPLSRTLRQWAEAGHAAAVTLAQLQGTGPLKVSAEKIWAVENPSVLAVALRRFGTDCPPLICTGGWPSTAGVLLLRRLREVGAEISYHGDLDGEGIRIAAHLSEKVGASPWRMSADDYLNSVLPTGPSPGRITEAPWDPRLAPVMRRHGVAVPEEQVVDQLLQDLLAATSMQLPM